MNGTTHKIGGICTGAVVCSMMAEPSLPKCAVVMAMSVFGSLFPDIDEPNSMVGKNVKVISSPVKKIFGHRGIIHTPLMLAVFTGLLYFLHLEYAPGWFPEIDYSLFPWMLYAINGFVAGYSSHLLLDLMTPAGIMLFLPVSSDKVSILEWKSRSRDIVCSGIMIVGTAIYLLVKYKLITVTLNTVIIG